MRQKNGTYGLSVPAQKFRNDAQKLLMATARAAEEQVSEARAGLAAAVETGRGAWHTIRRTAKSGLKNSDRAVRRYPYPTIAVAFGLGVILGTLARPRN
jgi:ElaB/YqjD/DUF883 family membrane-anchored ribosome-binding protein